MIKKSINRRGEPTSNKQSSPDNRYQKATHSVAKTYKQKSDSTVYAKYYTHKKKHPLED